MGVVVSGMLLSIVLACGFYPAACLFLLYFLPVDSLQFAGF